MTNEQKQILLKDLCARLPYGVKVVIKMSEHNFSDVYDLRDIENDTTSGLRQRVRVWHYGNYRSVISFPIEDTKPLLRSMSSMTEEEAEEYCNLQDKFLGSSQYPVTDAYELFDWLNVHYFDYRGLIPMGLALEAPEDMYKID